jgi:large subunit ribosomal protein L19
MDQTAQIDEAIREGDFIKVYQKITEGKKERIAPFQGKILKMKGKGANLMITVQNVLEGVLVERIYPVMSPTITKIEKLVVKQSKKTARKKATKRITRS